MNHKVIFYNEDPELMGTETFQDHKIVRPRMSSEVEMRKASETHLRSRFATGLYSSQEDINKILQHQFNFFQKRLESAIIPIAGYQLMEFLLHQYDIAGDIENMQKSGDLTDHENKRWTELGPVFRRAIKYLAEMNVMLFEGNEPDLPELDLLGQLDKALIIAEQMVDFYTLSDQTFFLFPEDTTLEILEEGELDFLDLDVKQFQLYGDFKERIALDRENRTKLLDLSGWPFYDVKMQASYLDDAFLQEHDIRYNDYLGIIYEIIENAKPAPGGFPIPFCRREDIVKQLNTKEHLNKIGIEKSLRSFSISKKEMQNEGREIFKPKQEYRAYRRAFFEFPDETGTHLIWSKEMAKENYMQLVIESVFNKYPKELETEKIKAAFSKLSNAGGSWFEEVVAKNLEKFGFLGRKSFQKGIGQGDARIKIPSEVGEIDYIGYSSSEKILLIAECKMVRSGMEPTFFRDDISDFVTSSKPYIQKFNNKIAWVSDNIEKIKEALETESEFPAEIEFNNIGTALITCFPTFASYFIHDFPCISLVEFCLEYERIQSWPYNNLIKID